MTLDLIDFPTPDDVLRRQHEIELKVAYHVVEEIKQFLLKHVSFECRIPLESINTRLKSDESIPDLYLRQPSHKKFKSTGYVLRNVDINSFLNVHQWQSINMALVKNCMIIQLKPLDNTLNNTLNNTLEKECPPPYSTKDTVKRRFSWLNAFNNKKKVK